MVYRLSYILYSVYIIEILVYNLFFLRPLKKASINIISTPGSLSSRLS
jgi:hypothetical protein